MIFVLNAPVSRYMVELAISFLPYWLVFLWCSSVRYLVCAMRERIRVRRLMLSVRWWVSALLLLWIGSTWWRYYYTVELAQQGSGQILTIWYGNILYTNTEGQQLQQQIKKADPDVILLIEATNEIVEDLYTGLLDKYPYSNRNILSRGLVGSVVLSKYPLEIASEVKPHTNWRYSWAHIDPYGLDLQLYLVHTSSPISPLFFRRRNEQLQHISTLATLWRNRPDLIIGDINVSPWSYWYSYLDRSLGDKYINITRMIWPLFTWRQLPLSWMRSHIDHAWIYSDLWRVVSLDHIPIVWSDHDGFIIQIERL